MFSFLLGLQVPTFPGFFPGHLGLSRVHAAQQQSSLFTILPSFPLSFLPLPTSPSYLFAFLPSSPLFSCLSKLAASSSMSGPVLDYSHGPFKWTVYALFTVQDLCLLFLCDKVGSIGVQFNHIDQELSSALLPHSPSFLLKIVQLASVKSATIGNFFFNSLIAARFKLCCELLLKEKKKLNNFFCVNFMLVTKVRIDSPGD